MSHHCFKTTAKMELYHCTIVHNKSEREENYFITIFMSFIHKAFSFTIFLFTKNMQIKYDLRK